MIVSGKISVKAILEERKRLIETVFIEKGKNDKEARYVRAKAQGLNVKEVSREELNDLAQNQSHGGYAVLCGARRSDRIADLPLSSLSLMCVEGVSDPYNMGEILRTVAAMGFDGVVTPTYNYYEHEAKLIRASAGASEKLFWLQSEDLEADIQEIKNQDIKIVAAYRGDDSKSLLTYSFPQRVCICLGGAYRGLSRKLLDMADESVRIDYDARIALSTVGACTVFAYARFAQREESK